MKLIVNTASSYKGGGVQVSKSFIEECRKFKDNEYHVILGILLAEYIDKASFPDNFTFYEIGFRPATKVFSFSSHNSFFEQLEARVKPDCVFSVGGPAYWRPKTPHLMGYTLPHYIYPESPFFNRISLNKKVKWWLKSILIKFFIQRDADAYIVQTDDVNKRLRKWIGKNKVFTITNTVGSQFFKKEFYGSSLIDEKKSGEFRFLLLSAYYKHKNFEIINEVGEILKKNGFNNFKFVLTLPDDVFNKIFKETIKPYLINIGPIKPQDCPEVYKECDFVFLPTLLECFSATYVEGFVMQKPILTSDMPFAHTVCGDAAVYFDPLDAYDVFTKMKQVVNSRDLQMNLIRKGNERLRIFNSAEQRAGNILELCRKLIDEKL